MRRSYMDSMDEDYDDHDSLPEDPAQAFAEFSFRRIPRDNWLRKICITVVLNP